MTTTELDRLEADQMADQMIDPDSETGDVLDYETAELLAKERSRSGKLPTINAFTREQYYSKPRPQRNLQARTPAVYVETYQEESWSGESADETNDDPQIDAVKAVQRYRPSAAVSNDLVNEGHGFLVWKSNHNPDLPDPTSEKCIFCGEQLHPEDDDKLCEFVTPTHAVPVRIVGRLPGGRAVIEPDPFRPPVSDPELCRCNGCRERRMGKRNPGNQPVQCGEPACQREMDRKHQADKRDRDNLRDRLQAVEVIRQFPDLSDKDIAGQLGIKPVRVREARERVSPNP